MNLNRREFIKQGSLLTAGVMFGNSLLSEAKPAPIKNFGVQLYSVRDLMPTDPKGTMKALAAMGYTQFESYAGPDFLWGMTPAESKIFLGSIGASMVSTHFDIKKDVEQSIEKGAAAGLKYMLCPYVGPQKSLDDWKKIADDFNKIGEKVTKAGMKFGYHNHGYSFKALEGVIPQELLLANTDPKYVMFELDICWIVAAGQDAVAHLKKYGKRYELCHIKDMVQGEGEQVTQRNLGAGSVDFKNILAAAKATRAMKHYLVEQEEYPISPIESMKANADWMKKMAF